MHDATPLTDGQVERFAFLFRGLKRGYGLLEGRNVKRPLSLTLYRAHLIGTISIGIYPLTDEGVCGFATVDVDTGKLQDAVALSEALHELGLNCGVQVFTSRAKGFHVTAFFDDWALARAARLVLKAAVRQAGLDPRTEIFPKQDGIPAEGWGNYLNIPYYGKSEPGRRCALDPVTWQPMSLEPFLERIQPFPVAALVAVAEDLPDAAATEEDRPGKDEDDLNELFSATYNEGFRRAGAGLPSAVGVLRARGLPEDAAVALLVPWASVHFRPALPDEEVERHIRSMYARYGMPAKGLPLLYPLTAEESQHA